MSDTKFTVFMHDTLVDSLDEGFSAGDSFAAIDQIFNELPQLHPAPVAKRSRNRAGRKLKVYRGRYDWYDLGFSYVQIGKRLHVLELWHDADYYDPNRTEVDVVLGREPADENAPIEAQS
jgi:hypothetical protein